MHDDPLPPHVLRSASATPQLALIAVLLAATAWSAVLLQLWLSVRLAQENGKSIAHGVIVFLGYFTVLTNIFVAIVASAGALRSDRRPAPLYRPAWVGCATTAILLVGIAYHFLLRNIWSPQGAQWVADVLLHYVVPGGALLHWLGYRQAARLDVSAPLLWCVYPGLYLTYALVRGEVLHNYPYPFVDVAALGYGQVAINAAGLTAAFLVLGYSVWGIGRVAGRIRAG